MTAKDLYTALSAKYLNHYFGGYEELNVILDSACFPCVVVIPISKQVSFIADRFKVVETVVIASLDQMELDFETEQIYDEVLIKERELLANIFDFMPKIRSVQNLSELNKFDQNVIFAAMSIELVNDHVNCKI
jgi:hypothetical protein